ncbi:alpha/beta fold hydrolase [Halococcus agarilyticus]|uniref:alpha/beta fold hydrolase n=1 Tax=Halococcus agarilyticus TaxID=1232219 RepID=UPI000677EB7D|nr:alpha/beta hydrolase [Halococcus agarilyticus]
MVDAAGTIAELFGSDEATPAGATMLDVARDIRANPRTIDCRDGRQLGYADCGDPDGDPLLVFHGFPNSRPFGALFDAAGRERGLRIIAPERPGFGVSDPAPDRAVADWADDVADLADALGLDSFPVLGISGGGPYAAACAARLPERIERAGIACGLAPLDSVAWRDRLPFLIARHAKPLAKLSLWSDGRTARRNPEAYLESTVESTAAADADLWRGEVGQVLLESDYEAVSRHGYGPLADELAVFAGDWGFDLGSIDVPVFLWYGRADRIVPLSMGLYYAERIPTAEAHVYPDQGHLSIVDDNETGILDALVDGQR